MSFNFTILTLIFAAGGEGFWHEYSPSVAKLFNLLLFLGIMVYVLRRPISEALRARREGIRRDLMRAQEERDAALAKLQEVETRLARLDTEVEAIRAQAEREAADERQRIERSTEEELKKLSEQAQREIEGASKVARMELRRFAAEESVRMAEEMIRRDLRPEDDARLVREYVENLGGIKH
ncbi:MAG TPA: ATP synthase F0 subunit B [Pyrinomonadaceae bacterium]|jgi:F0F1-type ATP synthase membrane subunit b/b'